MRGQLTFDKLEMNLIGIAHKSPFLSAPERSPGSIVLEKLLKDDILPFEN